MPQLVSLFNNNSVELPVEDSFGFDQLRELAPDECSF